MLEAAIANMNAFGRVSSCGVISEYTDEVGNKRASPNMMNVVYKRINIRGFMCSDYVSTLENVISTNSDLLRSGKLTTLEDVSYGVESIPSAFVALFKGDNIGKKIIKIADED